MYICERCQETFDFPNVETDFTSEYFGAIVNHKIGVCPYCGSDEIDEMDKCDICGEWIAPGEELCENCHDLIRDIADEVKRKARYTTDRFNLDYNEFISHLMDRLEE